RPSVSFAEQRFCNVLDELCIAGTMARPAPMVVTRTDAINAFAAGWDESDAVIAVTQGALELLNREELQGMVAHELSHLREGDTRLKMQLAGMVYGLELVYNFGETVRERGGLGVLFGSAIKVAGFAGWAAGRMLKAAVSRQREYLADARAVQWTRSRDGLGGVLRKVMTQRRDAASAPRRLMGMDHPSVQHMLLVDVPHERAFAHWMDSHPTLEERVKRLYGRGMGPLPVAPDEAANQPDSASQGRPLRQATDGPFTLV
ncbi:MAG: M48 family metalloprotease, partial [Rhodoferax sp.]|nr:M48 family metalloprotease [Rhodoferax sp.]